jgi:NADH-quinone oxidoreductase subunit A
LSREYRPSGRATAEARFDFKGEFEQYKCHRKSAEGTPNVLGNYLPVLIFLVIGIIMGTAMLAAGRILGPSKPNTEKNSAYECGFEAFTDSRMKFDVRFYLVAILFIIFDLEIAFLFPWAVALKGLSTAAFVAMAVFAGILVVGFIYEWKKGALDWE